MTKKEIIEKFRNEALTAISFAEEQQTTKDETIISRFGIYRCQRSDEP